jgi:hypothetical protein
MSLINHNVNQLEAINMLRLYAVSDLNIVCFRQVTAPSY